MSTIDRRGATVSAADPPIGTNPNPDLAIKAPVRAATIGSGITLSGLQTIDGVALSVGDRVLVKDQTDTTTNGIYNAQTSTWTRTIDANNNSQFAQGLMVAVAGGAVNANGLFRLTTANPITLGTSALTWSLTTPPIGLNGLTITPAALTPNQGLVIAQNGAGTVGPAFSYNPISITDNLASGGNTVDGLSVFLGLAGSAINGARQAFQSVLWLTAPTSPTNPNRNYVAGVFTAQAISNDGGGAGTEKGSIFSINPVATLSSSAINMAECSGGEVDLSCALGSSVLDKYGWKIVQEATDKVAGSRNDAGLFFGNQPGAVGWGTLIQVGDGLNASPLKTTGAMLAIKGAPAIANGIDLSGATISGSAFKSPGFSVGGSGLARPSGINIGSAAASFGVGLKFADNSSGQVLIAGATRGIRIWTDSIGGGSAHIEGVDQTGTGSFQPLQINGSALTFAVSGAAAGQFAASGGFSVGTTTDPGAGAILANTDIYSNNANFLIRTKTALANAGGGGSSPTLGTNGPTGATAPTKWISFDDNGTTRRIPAW
jgi:hypothetical protein